MYPYGVPYSEQRTRSDTKVIWIVIGVACGIPVVLMILGIVASIAIPTLLGARQSATREEARNALRTVVSAEFAYYAANGEYAASLSELSAAGMLNDPNIASGSLPHGISLTLTASGQGFTATATSADPPFTLTADETGALK